MLSRILKIVYKESPRGLWKTQTVFARAFFKSAGSNFFLDDQSYNSYLNQIYNGSKPLSANIKNSFTNGVNIAELTAFFEQCITSDNIVTLLSRFEIPLSVMQNNKCLAKALANQVELIVQDEDEINDSISTFYLAEIDKIKDHTKSTWRYSIIMMDDVDEQLELLEHELREILYLETRYVVDIISVSSSREVQEINQERDIDIFILDIAVKAVNRKSQMLGAHGYYGRELYTLLVKEKPNVQAKSKFIFYTKLPEESIALELRGIPRNNLEVWKKGKISHSRMAEIVKNHLDRLYIQDTTRSAQYHF